MTSRSRKMLSGITILWLLLYLVVTVRDTNTLWPVTPFPMFARDPRAYVDYRLVAEQEEKRHIDWNDLGTNFGSWETAMYDIVLEASPADAREKLATVAGLVQKRTGEPLRSLTLYRDLYRLSDGARIGSTSVLEWP